MTHAGSPASAKGYSFEIEHVYEDIEPLKFWDYFVDHDSYNRSSILPGEITIDKPGAGHPQGLGAVRSLKIGDIALIEDIIGFEAPRYFSYAVHEGGMPVRRYQGEFFFDPHPRGMRFRYRGSFDRKYFGTGLFFRYFLRARMKGMIPVWAKGYDEYYSKAA